MQFSTIFSHSSWPVLTEVDGSPFYLVYYLAYYLIPSGVGKIFQSLFVLEMVCIIQALFITTLLLLLTSMITNIKNFLGLSLILIFWAGLDILGNMFFFQEYSHSFGEFPEWWAGASNFQFTGFTDLLYWVPQHALGGWLVTALCFYFFQKKQFAPIPFIVALSLLWSPFACIGLAPFLLLSLWKTKNWKEKIEWCCSRYGIFALCILCILLSYYSTSNFEQPLKWQLTKMGWESFFPRYISFLLLEFSIPVFFIWFYRNKLPIHITQLFYLTTAYLILIPHVYFGVYSDFAMRGSIVGLFSLALLCLVLLQQISVKPLMKIFFTLYIILISYSAWSDFYRAQKLKDITLNYGPTKSFAPNDISKQYLGQKDSKFFSIFF
jgi:hypothetical protein